MKNKPDKRNLGAMKGAALGLLAITGTQFAEAQNVASGSRAFIGGGLNNTASGNFSSILGGISNSTAAPNSNILGGNSNTAAGGQSGIVTGSGNSVLPSGGQSAILSGNNNTISCRRLSKSGFNCLSKSGQGFLIFKYS